MSTAVLAVAGCGGGGDTSSDQVRSTWKDAAAAAAGGDGTHFCALVTSAGKQTITSQTSLSCEDSVRLLGSRLTTADKAAIRAAKITKITVHGDDATVTYVWTRAWPSWASPGRRRCTARPGTGCCSECDGRIGGRDGCTRSRGGH